MYIVKTATAKMPSTCRHRYARVAVIELKPGFSDCRMISSRARGVARIVKIWEPVHVGTTGRSAYHRALEEAWTLIAELDKFHNGSQKPQTGALAAFTSNREDDTSDL